MASEVMSKLTLISLVVNILFPVFAYAFTSFDNEIASYDLSLDDQTLLSSGIQFKDADSLNLTYGSYITYNVSNQLIRVKWYNKPLVGDIFRFSRPSIVERGIGALTGDYFTLGGEELLTSVEGVGMVNTIYNSTIVEYFDASYNWTHIKLTQTGHILLFTPVQELDDPNNITQAVYETGELTVTLGKRFTEASEFNAVEFLDWYFGFILNYSNWGFPPLFSWIMRLWAALTLLAAVIVTKDLIPFV